MDAHRFDDLARLLARPATRRRFTRASFAFLAGWLASRAPEPAGAQDACGNFSAFCDDATPCCEDLGFTCCGSLCCGGPDHDCCDGVCTYLHDESNCGSCGNTCEGGDLCCNDACISSLDPNNCGACGATCGPCQVCADAGNGAGVCTDVCGPNESCVNGGCVECPPGTTLCNFGGGNRVCADLQTDTSNCGSCGNFCGGGDPRPDGEICVEGNCQCPADAPDVCGEMVAFCTNVLMDNSHCGDCLNNCEHAPNLLGSGCVDGSCQCPAGSTPCGDVCCPPEAVCENGFCQCPSGNCDCSGLSFPFVTCDGQCVNFVSDPMNCGGCGIVCPEGICVRQRCEPCAEGLTACGETCVDLMTDPANCGACELVCPAGFSCVDGGCVEVSGGSGEPPVAPTPTAPAGTITLPNTGAGMGGRSGDHDARPLVGGGVAIAAAAAWLRSRLRTEPTSDQQ